MIELSHCDAMTLRMRSLSRSRLSFEFDRRLTRAAALLVLLATPGALQSPLDTHGRAIAWRRGCSASYISASSEAKAQGDPQDRRRRYPKEGPRRRRSVLDVV